MKRLVLIVSLLLIAMLPAAAAAATTSDGRLTSDAVYRLQLRLSDLDYLQSYPSGHWDDATADACARYCAAHTTFSPLSAHLSAAKPAAIEQASEAAPFGGMRGQRFVWNDVRTRLTVGATYTLTACRTGVIAHVRYVGGEGYARITPVSAWDQATIRGLFGDMATLDAEPALLTLGGARAAASLSGFWHIQPDGSEVYALYFSGSKPDLCAISDVGHDAAIALASIPD